MNEVKLGNSHPLTEEMKPLKVGGETSSIETAKWGNGAKINGDLSVTGAIKGKTDIQLTDDITCDQATARSIVSTADGFGAFVLSGTAPQIYGAAIKVVDSGNFTIDAAGDITLDSATGNFIAMKGGTEFSVSNSAYAGMILGYTRIANNGTTSGYNAIYPTGTMTVLQTAQGTDVSISFVVPPSGNVEIVFSGSYYSNSRTLELALSDNASFNEINETHTYDSGLQSSDETDTNMVVASWAVTGLTAGASLTYYIAAAETLSGTSNFNHGRLRSGGTHFPPLIVKAIALPATITTGE